MNSIPQQGRGPPLHSVTSPLEVPSPVPEPIVVEKDGTDGTPKPRLLNSYLRILSYGTRGGGIFVIILGLLCAMGSGVALPLMNIVFGRLIGDFTQYFIPGSGFTKEKFLAAVTKNTLFILYLFLVKFILTYIYMICLRFVSLKASSTLRIRYIRALFAQPVSRLDEISSATVINAIIDLSNTIQQSIADRLAILFQTVTLLITAYTIAFQYSWSLTLVVSSAILFIAVCICITTPFLVQLLYSMNDADDRHMSIAADVLSSVRTVFSLNAEAALTRKYMHWVEESKKRGLRISSVGAIHLALIFFGVYCSFSLAFWYGLRQFYYGEIDDVNTIITVFFSVLIAVMVMGQIAAPLLIISKAVSASGSFFDVIDAPPASKTGLKSPQVSSEEDIVFEDVTFSYPSRPSVPVLRKFNARFEKGKTTALVGPSGSGKSTVVALLEGWYQIPAAPDNATRSGGIYIGGQSIDTVDPKWWRSQIGLIQQEPFLFDDTIFNNICVGLIGSPWEHKAEEVKMDLVFAACKDAYADGFIGKLPFGYDTVVGEGGVTLSGGQRQRLAIARAIVSRPSILILDEATSAIDIHSERIIQEALDRISKNCTTIVIAHRLSTIRAADHIIVMQEGDNIDEGTHGELMQRDGLYQKLVRAQNLEVLSTPTNGRMDTSGIETAMEGELARDITTGKDHDVIAPIGPPKDPGFLHDILIIANKHKTHWILFVTAVIASLGAGTGFSLQSWLFAKLFETFRFVGQDLLDAADFWALIFFILAIGMGVCYAMVAYSANSISMHVGSAARKDYFTGILHNPVEYFDREENSSGSLVSRLSSDTKQLQEFCGIPSIFPFIGILNVTGCLIIAFIYGWKLSAVGVFGVMPLLGVAAFLRIRHQLKLDAINAAVYADSSRFISEAVKGFRTVSSLTMEDHIIERYATLLGGQRRTATRKAWYTTLIFAFSDSMEFIAMALSFWYGGQLLASRTYDPRDFFVVYIAIIGAAQSAGVSLSLGPNIAQTKTSIQRILREASDVDDGEKPGAGELPTSDDIELELSHVTFQYLSRSSPVFANLSIAINSGQFVAFVGPSGCGKSTLISLLERFYEPTQGRILFGGRDLNEWDVHSYRRRVALVGQEPRLFEGSIRDNLLLGLEVTEDSQAEMEQACRDAEIHDFITSLPSGYATELGTNAQISLSGGQKQRLCIARALLRKPSLLLLDEATSSLDSESERLIQSSLERLAGKRQMIIIAVAHRLATIQKADCIYVFQEGRGDQGSRIVEQGTHHGLLQRRELYYHMALDM